MVYSRWATSPESSASETVATMYGLSLKRPPLTNTIEGLSKWTETLLSTFSVLQATWPPGTNSEPALPAGSPAVPAGPAGHCGPTTPGSPFDPAGPWGPTGPVAPAAPAG